MGRYKGRSVDRNRYGKQYSFRRAPRRMSFVGDQNVIMEMGILTFSNETVASQNDVAENFFGKKKSI